MEVCFNAVEDQSIPANLFVAMRIGDVQKQAKHAPSRTFNFPAQDDARGKNSFGRIEVFQRIGSMNVRLDGSGDLNDLNVPLDGFDPLKFRWSTKGNVAESAASPEKTRSPEKKLRSKERMQEAQNYIARHNLEDALAEAMRQVIRDRPDDPTKFLSTQMAKIQRLEPISGTRSMTSLDVTQYPTTTKRLPPIDKAALSTPAAIESAASPPPLPQELKSVPEAATAVAELKSVPEAVSTLTKAKEAPPLAAITPVPAIPNRGGMNSKGNSPMAIASKNLYAMFPQVAASVRAVELVPEAAPLPPRPPKEDAPEEQASSLQKCAPQALPPPPAAEAAATMAPVAAKGGFDIWGSYYQTNFKGMSFEPASALFPTSRPLKVQPPNALKASVGTWLLPLPSRSVELTGEIVAEVSLSEPAGPQEAWFHRPSVASWLAPKKFEVERPWCYKRVEGDSSGYISQLQGLLSEKDQEIEDLKRVLAGLSA